MREATLADYAQIYELERRFELVPKSYEEWSHLWINNPAYSRDWPIGWVLENTEGRIVGTLGNIPVHYEFEGRRLLTATSRAWVVELEYRGFAIALLDEFFHQPNVEFVLTTTLNDKASAAFQLFDPSRIPVGTWDEAQYWITQYAGFVASSLAHKNVPFPRLLTYPVSGALRFADRLTSTRVGIPAGISLDVVPNFDARFDAFWDELRRKRSSVLLCLRTQEVLMWHFAPEIAKGHVWIIGISRGPKLVAYGIFYRQDSPRIGLTRVRLADFQTLDGDYSLLAPVLQWGLAECRRQKIHVLEVTGLRSEALQVARGLRPRQRPLPSWISYYKAKREDLAERLKDAAVWDPSYYDGDSSL